MTGWQPRHLSLSLFLSSILTQTEKLKNSWLPKKKDGEADARSPPELPAGEKTGNEEEEEGGKNREEGREGGREEEKR